MIITSNKQSGFSQLIILLLILAMGGTGLAGWRVYSVNKAKNSAASSQIKESDGSPSSIKTVQSGDTSQGQLSVIKIPATNGQTSDVSINPSLFYDVTANKQRYFGKINKINDVFFRLSEVIYLKNDSLLTRLGNELHGPEPIMYFQTSKVSKLHQLNPSQAEYKAVIEFSGKDQVPAASDAKPSSVISEYIKTAQHQAVFFGDGKVYYAKLKDFSGSFLTSATKIYILRTNSSPGSAQTDVSLIVATAEEVSKYTKSQLLYWENLRSDGQISAAIKQHQQ